MRQGKLLTSTCWTVRSRNVRSERTGITDLGPWQPIEVPRPPLSLTTTNLLSKARASSWEGWGRSAYVLTLPSGSCLIFSHTMDGPSSWRKRLKRRENPANCARKPSRTSGSAVKRSSSNSCSNWSCASRLVRDLNSRDPEGTRWWPRAWKNTTKFVSFRFRYAKTRSVLWRYMCDRHQLYHPSPSQETPRSKHSSCNIKNQLTNFSTSFKTSIHLLSWHFKLFNAK